MSRAALYEKSTFPNSRLPSIPSAVNVVDGSSTTGQVTSFGIVSAYESVSPWNEASTGIFKPIESKATVRGTMKRNAPVESLNVSSPFENDTSALV